MDTLEKFKLNGSIHQIARFLKSRLPTYNSEVLDTAGRKTKRMRKRTQAVAKRYVFHANLTIIFIHFITTELHFTFYMDYLIKLEYIERKEGVLKRRTVCSMASYGLNEKDHV